MYLCDLILLYTLNMNIFDLIILDIIYNFCKINSKNMSDTVIRNKIIDSIESVSEV